MLRAILSFFLFLLLILFSILFSFLNKKKSINEYFTNELNNEKISNEYYPLSLNFFDVDKRNLNIILEEKNKEDIDKSYDSDTFIYNIFLDYNNKNLVIIGPDLVNLKKKYINFDIYFNNFKLESELKEKYKVFYYISCKVNNVNNINEVKIVVGKNSKIFKVLKNNYKCGERILVTLQKNNRHRWIEDWIKFYTNRYNITNIIIFDNNSDSFDELKYKLSKYKHVNLIPYNFPYGLKKKFDTNFLQPALLNIALEQFCDNDTYLFNFDIDELLIIDPNHLNKVLEKDNIFYLVNMWWVPMTLDKNTDYSYTDFKFKKKNGEPINKSPKYIINKKYTNSINVHEVNSNSIELYENNYFLHFKGINNNWKYNRLEKHETKELIPIDDFKI